MLSKLKFLNVTLNTISQIIIYENWENIIKIYEFIVV